MSPAGGFFAALFTPASIHLTSSFIQKDGDVTIN
jgi:hypothetical protein